MSKQIEEVMALADEFALKTDAYQNDEVSREDLFAARRAVKDKLRALLPVWHPIETAPKDTEILVTGAKRIGICVAHNDSRDGWETETSSEWVSIYTPTHWMPLPAPPSQEGAT